MSRVSTALVFLLGILCAPLLLVSAAAACVFYQLWVLPLDGPAYAKRLMCFVAAVAVVAVLLVAFALSLIRLLWRDLPERVRELRKLYQRD